LGSAFGDTKLKRDSGHPLPSNVSVNTCGFTFTFPYSYGIKFDRVLTMRENFGFSLELLQSITFISRLNALDYTKLKS